MIRSFSRNGGSEIEAIPALGRRWKGFGDEGDFAESQRGDGRWGLIGDGKGEEWCGERERERVRRVVVVVVGGEGGSGFGGGKCFGRVLD